MPNFWFPIMQAVFVLKSKLTQRTFDHLSELLRATCELIPNDVLRIRMTENLKSILKNKTV